MAVGVAVGGGVFSASRRMRAVGIAVDDAASFSEGEGADTARTVRVSAVSPAATVRRPSALTEAPDPPPMTVQVTAWDGSLSPETRALNCWVPPFATDAEEGVTMTEVTVGAGGVLLRFSQAARIRASAKAPARSARSAPKEAPFRGGEFPANSLGGEGGAKNTAERRGADRDSVWG